MTDTPIAPRKARIARLMAPRSVAVIGASDKPGALGTSLIANLDRANFAGEIHLVNPKREAIGRRPCVASVADLPEGIDVAVLCVPQGAVLETVRELAARGTGAAIVYAAGFAEGGKDGTAQQDEIARIAAETGMIIEGPNCLGLVNFRENIPLTFIDLPEPRSRHGRSVGIVSQSGAMAAVLATNMIARDVPVSSYVSTGNEAAAGVEDFIDVLLDDPETVVIGLMVEHFRKPSKFLDVARKAAAAGTPIVLLHPGRSEAGRESAATHTGAMVGDYDVMRALVTQAGVILVDGLEELGDVVEMLVRSPHPPGDGLAIVAESGALKALMLDQSEELGIALPALEDADSPGLREALPAFVPVSNPLDITAQGLVDPGLYARVINALGKDERVGTILVAFIQSDLATSRIKIDAVLPALTSLGGRKPVIVTRVDEGGRILDDDVQALRDLGVPYYPTPERVLRALGHIARRGQVDAFDPNRRPAVLDGLVAGELVPEYRAKQLLEPHGVMFSLGRLATDLEAALGAAKAIGYPVALKAQAAALAHKTDAGGVMLQITDADALRVAWQTLHDNVARNRPGIILDGILVEAMAARGLEMIVGARVDPEWGPVVMAGFGGVAAELLHDVALLPADLPRDNIRSALLGLRMAQQLTGFRGSAPVDLDALIDLIQALGRVLLGTPAIREIDLNPVILYPQGRGAIALDALISA